MQQADVEEKTVQPSDAGRQRCLGSHPEVRPDVQQVSEHQGEDGGGR